MKVAADLLDLDAPDTWPADLLGFLDRHHGLFLAWEEGTARWQDYDPAIDGLRELLARHALVGWHCTRLTDRERAVIAHDGMQLPDRTMLDGRLNALLQAGMLDEIRVAKLKANNQANEENRARRIWFCFYPPRTAGEGGIHWFFRFWGGEALYHSHAEDAETGPAIACIGRPCLIEATVPLAGMGSDTRAAFNVVRRYLIHRGFRTEEPVELEGPTKAPLPAANIRRIIVYPEPDFIALTGCDGWRTPLPSYTPA